MRGVLELAGEPAGEGEGPRMPGRWGDVWGEKGDWAWLLCSPWLLDTPDVLTPGLRAPSVPVGRSSMDPDRSWKHTVRDRLKNTKCQLQTRQHKFNHHLHSERNHLTMRDQIYFNIYGFLMWWFRLTVVFTCVNSPGYKAAHTNSLHRQTPWALVLNRLFQRIKWGSISARGCHGYQGL